MASDMVRVKKDLVCRLPEGASISLCIHGLHVKDLKNILECFSSDILKDANGKCEGPSNADALESFIEQNQQSDLDSWYRFKDADKKDSKPFLESIQDKAY